jgi:hypothetical protein
MDWLQTWDARTVEDHRQYAGDRLECTASDQFDERDVRAGDRLFIAYVGDGKTKPKGHLFLVSRLVAEAADKHGRGWLTRSEARCVLGPDIWDASATVRAREGSASVMEFDREIPKAMLPKLRFLVRGRGDWSHTYLKLEPDGGLVQQTVRRVRRLDPESADTLETLLS